jgi:hypothetical protein
MRAAQSAGWAVAMVVALLAIGGAAAWLGPAGPVPGVPVTDPDDPRAWLDLETTTARVEPVRAPEPAPRPPPVPDPALAEREAAAAAWERTSDAGLDWLRRHQSRDGSWSCDAFRINCTKNICDGPGASADYTPGTTSLALLAFLGAGHSMRHGTHKGVVKRGLKYLKSIQTPDGCVGPKVADGRYLYNHAIGTLALAEGYGMSGLTPALKRPSQKAVDFLMSAQNPYLGWRYGIRPGDNDTAVTGWAVLALKAATLSELSVPPEGFAGAKNWLDKVTDDSFYKTGYTQKGDQGPTSLPQARQFQPNEGMTAAALLGRILMGARAQDPVIRGGATLLRNQPPRWDPEMGNDYHYWFFGTSAMFQVGGDSWRVWSQALDGALVRTQRRGGDEHGSWDPRSRWGGAGGRVYATAMNLLTLQTYYRYPQFMARQRRGR